MKLLNALILSSAVSFSALFAAEYKVDLAHSYVGFKVRHMMVSNTKGEFQKFSGHYDYDASTKKISSLSGVVEVDSVNTREKKRDDHPKKPEFFDAQRYPKMLLKLVKHEGSQLTLDLTIKETTKRVTFEVEDLSVDREDPWGYTRTGFVMHGKIDRKDYGISFNKALDNGGIVVGNEVKITIEIEGIKQ